MRLCPWSLALASSIPVLGLESVCPRNGCPWPWPRIFLCPRPLASSLVFSTPPLPFRHNQNHGWHEIFTTASRNLPNGVEIVLECCCCCSAYLSSCHRTASDANLLDDPQIFPYDYFVIGGIRTCLGVSDDPMLL